MLYHPRQHAEERPDAPAIIMGGSGEVVSFRDLEERANRLAHVFRNAGLHRGDHVAVMMENNARYFEVAWAAQRAGLYYTAINSHLRTAEVQYIVDDCGARGLITSAEMQDAVAGLDVSRVELLLMVTDEGQAPAAPFRDYQSAVAAAPTQPIADEAEGREMLYSSGTTGRPKGIRKPLPPADLGDPESPAVATALSWSRFQIGPGSVYLSPAPLYHAAPLVCSMAVHRLGGTVVVMERFDPGLCLELIERYRVTAAQFVPTMFARMLRLPEDERAQYDLASLSFVVHAAAPCPVSVKRQMIDWWGPIIQEYYSGTEDIGYSWITAEEWLAHPGSVGRPMTECHIVGSDGEEVPVGEVGAVYFAGGRSFEYHNDPAKTASIANARGWRTLGDIGYLDSDGYLYLTDRQAHMIIAGGVNIYPQEAEDVLAGHPAVVDVAVIGVPNDDLGEEVKAVVQVVGERAASPELEQELLTYCREHLAAYKCPRTIDFVAELPRDPSGKLYKRHLRECYWEGHEGRVI
jgi:fatty-acyl-CoA synthase